MEYKKIDKVIISEEIIAYFKNQILHKDFKPGEKLPSEEELSSQMGVSRGTIREALKVLIHMGLIERKNRGTYITETSQNIMALTKVKNYKDIFDIIEVRKIIEPALAKLAAENIDQQLQEKFDKEMKKVINDKVVGREAFWEHDIIFHDLIFLAAGNKILEDFIKGLKGLVYENQSLLLNNDKNDVIPKALKNHIKIYNAVKEKNGSEASKWMQRHINEVGEELKKVVLKRFR